VKRVQSSAASVNADRPVALTPAAAAPHRLLRAGSERAASERRLVRDAQRGSVEALETLFKREWPRAYRAAYLVVHDASVSEDIAQEAFLAAVRALDRFDRRRPFGPWMHRIAVNRAIDVSRARALRREVDAAAAAPEQAPPDRPSLPYSEELLGALRQLGPEQRAIVALRYLFEYTPGEIAKALELPRGTVNSRLRRALDRLAELLPEEASP
jgi:RNA polymerase sigma-70 factor (ECF subfamily)